MSRFLMVTWPFYGHVFPSIAVARELRENGHEVAFFTGEEARGKIEDAGFELFPFETIGEPWLPINEIEKRLPSRRVSLSSQSEATRKWLLDSIPAQVDDLEPVIDRFRPGVIVSEPALLAPMVVIADKHEIPVALLATFMGPQIPGPDAPPVFGFGMGPAGRGGRGRATRRLAGVVTDLAARGFRKRIDSIRADHGLGPLDCSVNELTARVPLFLVPNLRELDYDRRDLPDTVRYVGPCTYQTPATSSNDEFLDGIRRDRPWVHVTEGTSHQGRPFLLGAAAEGLAGAELEAILTTGQREVGEVPLRSAPNVHVTRFLNHDSFLPQCRVLVTTGGAGATMAALRAGIPVVLSPTFWDQFDNGRRIVEAGVGLSVNAGSLTPVKLRDAVTEILGDSRFSERARVISAALEDAPGAAGAATLLADLARDGRLGPVASLR